MACLLPHTVDEIHALVQKLIHEDSVRQKAMMDLAVQFDNASAAKQALRQTYEKCNDIPQETRNLIDAFLKRESDKDYEIKSLYMYRRQGKWKTIDEEVLRETLEEQARAEKEWEDRIKKEEAERGFTTTTPSSLIGMVSLTITFYHEGVFVGPPLEYLEGNKDTMKDLDFGNFTYGKFFECIKAATLFPPVGIFYCLPGSDLSDGIRELKNEQQLADFVATALGNGGHIDVYVEHHGYDIHDWFAKDNDDLEDYDEDECVLDDISSFVEEPQFIGEEEVIIPNRLWEVYPSGYREFEVRKLNAGVGVNLETHKCTCRLWDLTGIPCIHGVAAYAYLMKDPAEGVSDFYSKTAWQNCYISFIKPVSGQSMWVKTGLPPPMPPKKRVMPGRPKRKRQKHPSEVNDSSSQRVSRFGRTMTCSNCYQRGHNKKRCKNETVDPPPKEVRPKGKRKGGQNGFESAASALKRMRMDATASGSGLSEEEDADPANADHANVQEADVQQPGEMEQPVHMEEPVQEVDVQEPVQEADVQEPVLRRGLRLRRPSQRILLNKWKKPFQFDEQGKRVSEKSLKKAERECFTIEQNIDKLWEVYPCGYREFEVRKLNAGFGVNLETHKCTCRLWDLTGIPLKNSMSQLLNLSFRNLFPGQINSGSKRLDFPPPNASLMRDRNCQHCTKEEEMDATAVVVTSKMQMPANADHAKCRSLKMQISAKGFNKQMVATTCRDWNNLCTSGWKNRSRSRFRNLFKKQMFQNLTNISFNTYLENFASDEECIEEETEGLQVRRKRKLHVDPLYVGVDIDVVEASARRSLYLETRDFVASCDCEAMDSSLTILVCDYYLLLSITKAPTSHAHVLQDKFNALEKSSQEMRQRFDVKRGTWSREMRSLLSISNLNVSQVQQLRMLRVDKDVWEQERVSLGLDRD
ncbi:zinc finger, PMZ-type containing protein [Tanacetum coccineum]